MVSAESPFLSVMSVAFPFCDEHSVHVLEPAQKYPARQLTHSVAVPVQTLQPSPQVVPHISSVVSVSSLSVVSTAVPFPSPHSWHFWPVAPSHAKPALQLRQIVGSEWQDSHPAALSHVVEQAVAIVSAERPPLSVVSEAFPFLPEQSEQVLLPPQKYPALQLMHSVAVPVQASHPAVPVQVTSQAETVKLAPVFSAVSAAFPFLPEHSLQLADPSQKYPALQFKQLLWFPSQASQPEASVQVVPQVPAASPVLSVVSTAFPFLPEQSVQVVVEGPVQK